MITVNDHDLVGIDAHGCLCSCGIRTDRWENHLYLVALRDLGVPVTDERTASHRSRHIPYAERSEEWKKRQRASKARSRERQRAAREAQQERSAA